MTLPDLVRERIQAELERQAFALEVLGDLGLSREEFWQAWIDAMTEAKRERESRSQGLTG